jgi:hypothetical protein
MEPNTLQLHPLLSIPHTLMCRDCILFVHTLDWPYLWSFGARRDDVRWRDPGASVDIDRL